EIVVLILASVEIEITWRHADHRAAVAVKTNGFADDIWIAAEMALPKPIAENDNLGAAGSIFGLAEKTAERGLDFQSLKEIGGDGAADHPFRLTLTGNYPAHWKTRRHL